jgi:hypothetical protein
MMAKLSARPPVRVTPAAGPGPVTVGEHGCLPLSLDRSLAYVPDCADSGRPRRPAGAASDYPELLARTLTIAQDTAMRDKGRPQRR